MFYKMIFLFTCCLSYRAHYFSFKEVDIDENHYIENDYLNLTNNLQLYDSLIIRDHYISENIQKFLTIFEYCITHSITIIGSPTTINFKFQSFPSLKNINITIKNVTFLNCGPAFFKANESTIELSNLRFYNTKSSAETFFSFINCTIMMDSIYFYNGNSPFLSSYSSIISANSIYFSNLTANQDIFQIFGSSFESSFFQLVNSNIQSLISLKNSLASLNNFQIKSSLHSSLISSQNSDASIKQLEFKQSRGPILSAVGESITIAGIELVNHISESPLFVSNNLSFSLSDCYISDSNIDSIVNIHYSENAIVSNLTATDFISTNPLFEIEETSCEFSSIIIDKLVSNSGIVILHQINSDCLKLSQSSIKRIYSKSRSHTSFAFSEVSSIFIDGFTYHKNGSPLLIANHSHLIFVNSLFSQNDCIQFSSNKIRISNEYFTLPSSLIYLYSESSLHLVHCKFFNNTIKNGFSVVSHNSSIFLMASNFTSNSSPLYFIQSTVKITKSAFSKNSNQVIKADLSEIVIKKSYFSLNTDTEVYIGNQTVAVINATISSSPHFLEASPSASSIIFEYARFDSSFSESLNLPNLKIIKFINTMFNCSKKCEYANFEQKVTLPEEIKNNPIIHTSIDTLITHKQTSESEINENIDNEGKQEMDEIIKKFDKETQRNSSHRKPKPWQFHHPDSKNVDSNEKVSSNIQSSFKGNITKRTSERFLVPKSHVEHHFIVGVIVVTIGIYFIWFRFRSQRYSRRARFFLSKGKFKL